MDEWREKKYYKSDAIRQLFNCSEDIERRSIETLSVEEFIERYEKENRAVIITGMDLGMLRMHGWLECEREVES